MDTDDQSSLESADPRPDAEVPPVAAPTPGPRHGFAKLVRQWWKWLVGIVVVALGATIAADLQCAADYVQKSVVEHVTGSGPEPPFSVDAALDPPPDLDFCGSVGISSWVFKQLPAKLAPPTANEMSSPAALEQWATDAGGVPAGGSVIRMTVLGTQGTVVLQAMRVTVVARKHPLGGTIASMSGGCGGLIPAKFSTDIDQLPIRVVAQPGSAGPDQPMPAVPFPHQISASQPEQLYLEVNTQTCTCDVEVLVDWSDADSHGTVVIDDGDTPFHIAGQVGSHQALLQRDTLTWACETRVC